MCPCTYMQEDWVLCRVFYKKKADALDYGMDNEQEIAMARSAVASRKYSASSGPDYWPPFPTLGSSHYQLPPSSDHHGAGADSISDFSAMAPLQHNDIFDFNTQHLDSGTSVLAAGASRDGSGEQCGGGALTDLGQEEQYIYNGLMQM
jgi:hypothetical protein